jgi:hypothetical protein
MGVYVFQGIFIVDNNDEEELDMGIDLQEKINFLIQSQIANTSMSYLSYITSDSMKELIIPEADIFQNINNSEEEDEEEDEDYEDEIEEGNLKEAAAEILLSIMNKDDNLPSKSIEEEIIDEDEILSEENDMDNDMVQVISDDQETIELFEKSRENISDEEPMMFKPMNRKELQEFSKRKKYS